VTIRRLSSGTHHLDQSFLAEQLKGALSYRRIAGYFTSSLFEIAHEWLEPIPDVRIVCNVDLAPEDLKVAHLRGNRGRCGLARSRVLAGASPAWVIVRREPSIEPCGASGNRRVDA
jgi:hypothetical protein